MLRSFFARGVRAFFTNTVILCLLGGTMGAAMQLAIMIIGTDMLVTRDINGVLAATNMQATQSVLRLDKALAVDISQKLLERDHVISAKISDDLGGTLGAASWASQTASASGFSIAHAVLPEIKRYQLALDLPDGLASTTPAIIEVTHEQASAVAGRLPPAGIGYLFGFLVGLGVTFLIVSWIKTHLGTMILFRNRDAQAQQKG